MSWRRAALILALALAAPSLVPQPRAGERHGDPSDIYETLRNHALDAELARTNLAGQPGDTVWAVVMDFGMPEGSITLLAMRDHTVSIYYSQGGGVLGQGGDKAVWSKAEAWLAIAQSIVASVPFADPAPRPPNETTRISLITPDGVRSQLVQTSDLKAGHHALAALYASGQPVFESAAALSKGK